VLSWTPAFAVFPDDSDRTRPLASQGDILGRRRAKAAPKFGGPRRFCAAHQRRAPQDVVAKLDV
jgi:hypothetical protein